MVNFKAGKKDTLSDIVFGCVGVAGGSQAASLLFIKPQEGIEGLEVSAYSSKFHKGKIDSLNLALSWASKSDRLQGFEQFAIKTFGGDSSFSLKAREEFRDEYEISASSYLPFLVENRIRIRNDAKNTAVIPRLLNTLGIMHRGENQDIEIQRFQWKKIATTECQFHAYNTVLQNCTSPYIYSSRGNTAMTMSQTQGKPPQNYLCIKVLRPYPGISSEPKDVDKIQPFMEKNFGIKLNGRVWEITNFSHLI
ncbi:MAG: hypothetical protein ABIB71_06265 [Candidatus Woesearchaeota archaeon]